MALKAEIKHEAGFVYITFGMPELEFVKLSETLKANKSKAPAPVVTSAPDISTKKQKLRALIQEFKDKNPDLHPSPMYLDFFRYWGEPSKNGKNIRYEGEKYFDMGKRLATFRRNIKPDQMEKLWTEHHAIKNQTTSGTNQLQ